MQENLTVSSAVQSSYLRAWVGCHVIHLAFLTGSWNTDSYFYFMFFVISTAKADIQWVHYILYNSIICFSTSSWLLISKSITVSITLSTSTRLLTSLSIAMFMGNTGCYVSFDYCGVFLYIHNPFYNAPGLSQKSNLPTLCYISAIGALISQPPSLVLFHTLTFQVYMIKTLHFAPRHWVWKSHLKKSGDSLNFRDAQ